MYLSKNVMVYVQVGIPNLIALQSGFSAINLKKPTRNQDLWHDQEKGFPARNLNGNPRTMVF
jgi:hypothetical protein